MNALQDEAQFIVNDGVIIEENGLVSCLPLYTLMGNRLST